MIMFQWKPEDVVRTWLARNIGKSFAEIQTKTASYSRALIVSETDTSYFVEFPKSTGNKDRPWKIVQDTVAKKDVWSIRYYTDKAEARAIIPE